MTSGPGVRNMLSQHAPDLRQRSLCVAADQQCRRADRFRFASRKGFAVLADLAEHRKDVVAQLLPRCGGQAPPCACRRRSPRRKPLAHPRCRQLSLSQPWHANRGRARWRTGYRGGSSDSSSSPPGSASTSLRSRSGRCCATRNPIWPPREWPIRSTGPAFDPFDEADHVGDMLRHQIVVADAIPMFREKVAQADRDHAMLFRQRSEHRVPGAEIAERAVHADQRRARFPTSR